MGLMLVRAASAFGQPSGRIVMGALGGTAMGTGVIVAGQYADGHDFSEPTGIPTTWPAGLSATASLAAVVTGGVLSQPGEYGRKAWKGGYGLAGAGVGLAAATFLVTPVLRRMMADQ